MTKRRLVDRLVDLARQVGTAEGYVEAMNRLVPEVGTTPKEEELDRQVKRAADFAQSLICERDQLRLEVEGLRIKWEYQRRQTEIWDRALRVEICRGRSSILSTEEFRSAYDDRLRRAALEVEEEKGPVLEPIDADDQKLPPIKYGPDETL